jgi:hypothetical protein
MIRVTRARLVMLAALSFAMGSVQVRTANAHPLHLNVKLAFVGGMPGPCQHVYTVDCPSNNCGCLSWEGTATTPAGLNSAVQFQFTVDNSSGVFGAGGEYCHQGRFWLSLNGGHDLQEWVGPGARCTTVDDGITRYAGQGVLKYTATFLDGSGRMLGMVKPNNGILHLIINGTLR